jgi:hypothetical protein
MSAALNNVMQTGASTGTVRIPGRFYPAGRIDRKRDRGSADDKAGSQVPLGQDIVRFALGSVLSRVRVHRPVMGEGGCSNQAVRDYLRNTVKLKI